MGQWVKCEQRNPTAPGAYTVRRRSYGRKLVASVYRWNGGYWVTAGHSIAKSVVEWYEPSEAERPAADTKGEEVKA